MDLSVETTSTHKCRVEDFGAVGCCKDNDTAVCVESVHFGKKLVKSVFSLIVTTEAVRLSTGATYGINFIDEDNARSLALCLTEKVTYTRCANAYKHFNKIATAEREERNIGFACYCLSQQGLTGSWRAYKQCALWNLSAEFRVFVWIL